MTRRREREDRMDDDLGTAMLRFERAGPIAWCVIDRPDARNALTPAMYYGLKRAVGLVNRDPELAALIITGVGDVFAPGGDLGGRSEPGESLPDHVGQDVLPFLAIRDSQAPVIAAVNGICQAGGLLIAMLADIAVVSDRATFRVPELLRGIPDATYAAVLPAHVGVAVARDLLLSARRFDAAEAHRLGLIARVVPHDQLRSAALEAAHEVLQTAPSARAHVTCSTSATATSTTRPCSGPSSTRTSRGRGCGRSWRSGRRAGCHRNLLSRGAARGSGRPRRLRIAISSS
jgi:enoyl-CoA hydratase/carnithine racemase